MKCSGRSELHGHGGWNSAPHHQVSQDNSRRTRPPSQPVIKYFALKRKHTWGTEKESKINSAVKAKECNYDRIHFSSTYMYCKCSPQSIMQSFPCCKIRLPTIGKQITIKFIRGPWPVNRELRSAALMSEYSGSWPNKSTHLSNTARDKRQADKKIYREKKGREKSERQI